ncbi:MAG: regulatory iron-sulfur-containing complex subunit RicT [Thermodesulfobacteriota bacterium]|nr:regulatory iron-sulfur-containing complex subunit RicT [Thermodesulfobacteriota bacterium]
MKKNGRVVGVKFRDNDKIYNFDTAGIFLQTNDKVVVETERGVGIATVVRNADGQDFSSENRTLKKVLRKANKNDIELELKNREKEVETYEICLEEIIRCQLPMKLVKVEYLFDGSKIIFYFTAEGRVDFRELVKRLAHRLHTRIEMRQIGVRNETKIIGGIGSCGREFCCKTFLKDFEPVSVKIAKEQNLALNPAKISGVCGRLMCCLTFERHIYIDLKKDMPKCGKKVVVPQGKGEIKEQYLFEQKVAVELENGKEVMVPVSEVKQVIPPGKQKEKR